jgi:hypothetical protein
MDQASPPVPDLMLWRTDGCHLCDETADLLRTILAERGAAGRAVPRVVARTIAEVPATQHELAGQVPVLEAAGRRLPLAIRRGPIEAFLNETFG